MNRPPFRQPHEMDASIRLVSHYDCATDSIETRFDVLMGDEKLPCNQYPFALSSSPPGKSPLHIPDGRGVIAGFDVKVSSGDLVAALRTLATAIEQHRAKTAGVLCVVDMQSHPYHLTAVTPVVLGEETNTIDHMWRMVQAASAR